jgi:hypothetical protein
VRLLRASWSADRAAKALLVLLAAGAVLRIVAISSWWPVTTILDDQYAQFATDPFANSVHPAGYSLVLAALGGLTRQVAVPVMLQHLAGIASALLIWGATKRVTGSSYVGLVPAAIVLLAPDQIILEHSIMSESSATLLACLGLYAAVRAFDEPRPWWRWPSLCGATLGLAVTIRTAGLLLIPVAVLALFLSRSAPFRSWGRWEAPLASAAGAIAILLSFAGANAAFGDHFGIRSSPGWYLYGRAAQFADCSRFTPPPGSERLCEQTPPSERRGSAWYWGLGFAGGSSAPGPLYFSPFGNHDGLLDEWSRRAILAQPWDYLSSVWEYAQGYWYPGSPPSRADSGTGLDPQLAWADAYPSTQQAIYESAVESSLEDFYDGFTVHQFQPGLGFLRAWQRVLRFGPLALSITTLLTLAGLAIGTRRSRVAVFLFGIGGLTLLVPPAMSANYTGRYLVPLVGPMTAAAGIAVAAARRRLIRGA